LTVAKNQVRLWADLSLLVVTAVWGGTFVMVKDAMADAGPLTFVALRFALAAAVLAPLVGISRAHFSRPMALGGAAAGLFLFAGYVLQTAGLQFTSASKAGFITGLSVVIVPTVAAAMLRRPPARATAIGVALATVGLALLSLQGDLGVELGDLLVLGCAAAFALHILVVGHVAPKADVLALTSVQIAAAAAFTTVGAALFERPTADQLRAILPAAAFTGLFATVAAFYLQTKAQRFTTPTRTALIFSLEPVFAALFGFLLAGDRLGWRALVGCALILAGMLIAQLAPAHDAPAQEPFG
jgi:drug/metabolite transporter (DMT)-like permease